MDTGVEVYILSLRLKNIELKDIEEKTMERYSCSRKTFYNYWKKVKDVSDSEAQKILDSKEPEKYDFNIK